MKDYKEMTESVLQQANARVALRTRQRRMATGLIAATLCFAILIAVVGFGVGRNPAGTTQPTISMDNPTTVPITQPEETEPTQQELPLYTGQVYFLNANREGADLTPMQANMTVPVNSMFRVRSLQGMTDSEAEKVIEEEKAFQTAFKEKYGNSDGGSYMMHVMGGFSIDDREDAYRAVVQYLSGGKASLILLDASKINDFDVETTGAINVYGGYGTYNQDVTIGEGEAAVTIPEGCFRIYLHLSLGDKMVKIFREDPDTPLSTLNDTITVTINYKNGTKEIVVIDVTVDDEGYVYMTQRGNSTGV